MTTFDELWSRYPWREIRGCPGRFVSDAAAPALSAIAGGVPVHAFDVPAARDRVLVAVFPGGGLISYERADGSHLHTLNTPEGLRRKLAQLGIVLP